MDLNDITYKYNILDGYMDSYVPHTYRYLRLRS